VIFVDTSFWAALTAASDDLHDTAARLFELHQASQLVTSNHVRGETWTFLRRRRGLRSAVRFVDYIDEAPRLRLEFVSEAVESQAMRWLRRHDEREYSFVDATSFAVMRSLRMKEALAFDGDFAAAGFVELRP
jgi:uncharacterized protein